MRKIITRFTNAINCLKNLNHQSFPHFNITQCAEGGEGDWSLGRGPGGAPSWAPEKYCLVHIGLDPLPISGTFGGCIPDECTNVEMTDLLNLICALPNCEILKPLADFMVNDEILTMCSYVQRGLCGPDDRTMMQHEISFTCVPPPAAQGLLLNRRILSEMRGRWMGDQTEVFEAARVVSGAEVASTSAATAAESTSASSSDFDDLENELVEMFRKFFESLRLDDLIKFTSHLIEDLSSVLRVEIEGFWSGLKADLELDETDFKNLLFNDHKIDLLLKNISKRIEIRLQALHDSIMVIEDRLKDSDLKKIKELITTVQSQIKTLAKSDLEKLQDNVQNLKKKISDWLHKINRTERERVVIRARSVELINQRKLSKLLNELERVERRVMSGKVTGGWSEVDLPSEVTDGLSPIFERLKEILEKLRILIEADLPVLQDDISNFMKHLEDFLKKIIDSVFPDDDDESTIPSSVTTASESSESMDDITTEIINILSTSHHAPVSTPTSTQAPTMKPLTLNPNPPTTSSSTSGAASGTVESRKLEESSLTTSSSESEDISSQTEELSTEPMSFDKLERELIELRDLVLEWMDQFGQNNSMEAKKTFEEIENLITEIGEEFWNWGQAQISRAKALLQKLRQKCLIDRMTGRVDHQGLDRSERIEHFVRDLMAIQEINQPLGEAVKRMTTTSESKAAAGATTAPPLVLKEWPEAVSKFLKDFGQFSEDVVKVGTKALTEAATDETIRRDLEKLNRRFASISFLFTEDVVKVWNHWKLIVEDDLTKITKTVDEVTTRVKEDLDDRLKENEEFRKALVNDLKDIGGSWIGFWENFWNQTVEAQVEQITEQIRNLTQSLNIEVRERVQQIIDGLKKEEVEIRSRLEESIEKLRDDVQRMMDELKQKIDEIKNSTTTTQSVVSETTSKTTTSADGTTTTTSSSGSSSQTNMSTHTVTEDGQSTTTVEINRTENFHPEKKALEDGKGSHRHTGAESLDHRARLLEEISLPDLSMMSREILEFLQNFRAETRSAQQVFDNATFIAEIMMHFSPTNLFREIKESKPLWTTQAHLESVFTCGLQSLTEPTRLLYSGHMPQTLGDYDSCLGEDQTHSANRYCLVKGAAVIGEGRCVANACDEEKMRDLTDFICSWIEHHRSCLELVNIVPLDYCLFASLANCGVYSSIPNTSSPTSLIALPAWYNTTKSRVENQSWWSPDEMAAISLLSGSGRVETHKLHKSFQEHQIDYNMTEIVSKLGLPRYQVYCSATETSYWTWRSILGWAIAATALVILPTLAYLLPKRYLGHWRIGDNFKHWLGRVGSKPKDSSTSLTTSNVRRGGGGGSTAVKKIPTAALDGMRVLSIFWIIWGHTLVTVLVANLLENYEETIDLIRSFPMQGIISGVFAVDTFFAVGAFLLAYKSSKMFGMMSAAAQQPASSTHPDDDFLTWSKCVMIALYKRWARISPLYYFVLSFFILIIPNLVSAPMYPVYSHNILYGMADDDKQGCLKHWWTHLFYLDNLIPEDSIDTCMGWSWYLAVDMQLSILGIALTAIAARSRQAYRRLWWLTFILAFSWTLTLELQNHFTLGFLSLSSPDAKIDTTIDFETATARHKTYIRPWPRMLGYLLALSAGLHIADEQERLERAGGSGGGAANTSGGCVKSGTQEPLLEDDQTDSPTAQTTPMMLRSELIRPGAPPPSHTMMTSRSYEPVLYRKIKNWIIPGHLMALIMMAVIIWLPWFKGKYYKDDWPYGITLFYNLFSRSLWTISLLWFIYTCFLAHHEIIKDPLTVLVNTLLSSRYFTLLSPLVFGVYLIHMVIQQTYYASIQMTALVSLSEGFHEALGWIPLSFSLAIPLYLLIELPAARTL